MDKKTYLNLCKMVSSTDEADRNIAVSYLEENYADDDGYIYHSVAVLIYTLNYVISLYSSDANRAKDMANKSESFDRLTILYEEKLCKYLTRTKSRPFPREYYRLSAKLMDKYSFDTMYSPAQILEETRRIINFGKFPHE